MTGACVPGPPVYERRAMAASLVVVWMLLSANPDPHDGADPRVGDKRLSAWIKDLRSADRDTVIRASTMISHVGAAAEPAVPAFIGLLDRHDDEYLRWVGVVGLGDVGRTALPGIPHLVKALDDQSDDVRLSAAESLGQIAPGVVDQQAFGYLRDLEEAEAKISRMRDELDKDYFVDTNILLPIRRAIDSLERARLQSRLRTALGVLSIVLLCGSAVLAFPQIAYRARERLGAAWQIHSEGLAWRMRLQVAGDASRLLIHVTRGGATTNEYERQVAFPSNTMSELRRLREEACREPTRPFLQSYTPLIERMLEWDPVRWRFLLSDSLPVEIVAGGALQSEMLEVVRGASNPLGLERPMTRLILGDLPDLPERALSGIRRLNALVIGDPTEDLPGAATEARQLSRLLTHRGLRVTLLANSQATLSAVAGAMSRVSTVDEAWLIHFAGHISRSATPGEWHIELAGGPVGITEFAALVLRQPVVLAFANACVSVGELEHDSAVAGLGSLFLGAGVQFVGSQMPVSDGLAAAFARRFYRRWVPGFNRTRASTFGEAVLGARQGVADDRWFQYIAYGRSGMRLELRKKRRVRFRR
jgi:hypothetical protein